MKSSSTTKANAGFQIQTLPISVLKCAFTYNRPLRKAHLRDIVDNFNPDLLLPIVVNKRQDGYFIIDGQHRTSALKALGIATVTCIVHQGLTEKQEAEIFNNLDAGQKKLSTIESFNSAVFSGDKKAVDIYAAIGSAGLIAPNNCGKAPNKIVAIGEIDKIYDDYGLMLLARTLILLKKTWNGKETSLVKQMLGGMANFVNLYHQDFVDRDFIAKMHSTDPVDIVNAGKSNTAFAAGSRAPYAYAIWKQYNAGRTAAKRLSCKFSLAE